MALVPEFDPRLNALRQWRRERARLIKADGRFSAQVKRHLSSPPEPVKVQVDGIGEVEEATGGRLDARWLGDDVRG